MWMSGELGESMQLEAKVRNPVRSNSVVKWSLWAAAGGVASTGRQSQVCTGDQCQAECPGWQQRSGRLTGTGRYGEVKHTIQVVSRHQAD